MEDKIVLICATGRSGSTSLQRIINTIPNTNICGENFGAINSLLEFYKRIKKTTVDQVPGHFKPASYEDIISKNVKPSWYNSYNFYQIQQLVRATITNMFKNKPNTNIWGFKEIRYDYGSINYIKEFKELFPQTKVIIQIRENILKQSQSDWHKYDKNAVNYLNKLNSELLHFYNTHKEYCYFTTFEKMFDLENLEKIFKFIDCEEHFDKEKIKEVLNNNIKD